MHHHYTNVTFVIRTALTRIDQLVDDCAIWLSSVYPSLCQIYSQMSTSRVIEICTTIVVLILRRVVYEILRNKNHSSLTTSSEWKHFYTALILIVNTESRGPNIQTNEDRLRGTATPRNTQCSIAL